MATWEKLAKLAMRKKFSRIVLIEQFGIHPRSLCKAIAKARAQGFNIVCEDGMVWRDK